MTNEELKLIELTCKLACGFAELPVYHNCDRLDVARHIHAIQAIIMQCEAVRAHPDVFRCEINGTDTNKS